MKNCLHIYEGLSRQDPRDINLNGKLLMSIVLKEKECS